jgi:5-methyltetrahydrofolate--homocysteine methyltransferase
VEKEGVRHVNPVPTPPFWGARLLDSPDLDDIYNLLDTKILFKLNWGIRGRTADEYHALIHSTFEPLLEDLKEEARKHSWLLPAAVYGYYPVNASGDEVIIYDPFSGDDPWKSEVELGRFSFPRQPNGDRMCVADYFHPIESGVRDIIALQVVTMGERASEVVHGFTHSGEYAKGFFLHGLAMEAAEAFAELLHRRIKVEMGIDRGQGHRYSFGYPSTPDLSQQVTIFSLLDVENAIAARLTSMFQIVPEQSTSAFIVHHPDARYFHIEGEGLAAVLREPLE